MHYLGTMDICHIYIKQKIQEDAWQQMGSLSDLDCKYSGIVAHDLSTHVYVYNYNLILYLNLYDWILS
ncbi:hypothetical protein ACJX0J_012690, partial [Zea mays]